MATKRKRKVRPQTVQQVILDRPKLSYSEVWKRDRRERLGGLQIFVLGLGVTTFIIWTKMYDDWIGKGLVALGAIMMLLGFLALIQGYQEPSRSNLD
jgi:hypothetical protein